jgi:hypothetical protein
MKILMADKRTRYGGMIVCCITTVNLLSDFKNDNLHKAIARKKLFLLCAAAAQSTK